jgi:hypothetical protein
MCPDSVNIEQLGPSIDRSSPAAERGTLLHGILEAYYRDPDTVLDELCADLDLGDREAVHVARRAADTLMDAHGIDELECEVFAKYRDDIGGTADLVLLGPDALVLADYKFGYQPVDDWYQLLFYLMCLRASPEFSSEFEGRELHVAIIQPAVSEQAISRSVTVEELDKFQADYLQAIERGERGGTQGNPGDHCKYCAGSAYCDALTKQSQDFLKLDPKQMLDLADAMAMIPAIKEHIRAIEAEVFAVLNAGAVVPGWKLVRKQARRYWSDEAGIRAALNKSRKLKKEDYLDSKLRSPAQVEKLVKKSGAPIDVSLYSDNATDDLTIAPESDKRPAIEAMSTMVAEVGEGAGKLFEPR